MPTKGVTLPSEASRYITTGIRFSCCSGRCQVYLPPDMIRASVSVPLALGAP